MAFDIKGKELSLAALAFIIIPHAYFILGGNWSESYEFVHNFGNVIAGLYLFKEIFY